MRKPKFSVIIPYYNVKKEIFLRCIGSVINQTFKDFEIIIVNDGSEENYNKILDCVVKKDNRIRLINKDNEGVSIARNIGVEKSLGEYILFVDADDAILPYFLENANSILKKKDYDLIIGGNYYIENNELDSYKMDYEPYHEFDNNNKREIVPNMLQVRYFFKNGGHIGRGPVSRVVKRDKAKEVQFKPSLKIGEDVVWNLELINTCDSILIIDKVWYLNYNNSSSATRKPRLDAINEAERQLKEIIKYIDLNDDDVYVAYCERVLEELKRIFFTLIFKREFKIKCKKKCKIYSHLYNDSPWDILKEKKVKKIKNGKTRLKIKMYNLKVYSLYMRLAFLKGRLKKIC